MHLLSKVCSGRAQSETCGADTDIRGFIKADIIGDFKSLSFFSTT